MGSLLARCLAWLQADSSSSSADVSAHKRRLAPPLVGGISVSKKMPKLSNPGLLFGGGHRSTSSQRSSCTYLSTDNSPGSPRPPSKDFPSAVSPWGGGAGSGAAGPSSVYPPSPPAEVRTFWTRPPTPPGEAGPPPAPSPLTFLQAPTGYQQEMDDIRDYETGGAAGGGGGLGQVGGALKHTLSFRKNCDSATPRRARVHRKN